MTRHIAKEPVLVLAAGRGTRMGGPKALMEVNGRAWWRTQDERLESAGVEPVWVVSKRIAPELADESPRLVVSDDSAPMFASILAGMKALAARADQTGRPPRGAFILPIDVPAPSAEVWRALAVRGCCAVREHPAVPVFEGKRGHPVWLPWEWSAREVLARSGDVRLDELLRAGGVEHVEVRDPAVVVNLNVPGDVTEWEHRDLSE